MRGSKTCITKPGPIVRFVYQFLTSNTAFITFSNYKWCYRETTELDDSVGWKTYLLGSKVSRPAQGVGGRIGQREKENVGKAIWFYMTAKVWICCDANSPDWPGSTSLPEVVDLWRKPKDEVLKGLTEYLSDTPNALRDILKFIMKTLGLFTW